MSLCFGSGRSPSAQDIFAADHYLALLNVCYEGASPECIHCEHVLVGHEYGHCCRCPRGRKYLVNTCSICNRLMLFRAAFDLRHEKEMSASICTSLLAHGRDGHCFGGFIDEDICRISELVLSAGDDPESSAQWLARLRPLLEYLWRHKCKWFAYNEHMDYTAMAADVRTHTGLVDDVSRLVVQYSQLEWPVALLLRLPAKENCVYFWHCLHCDHLELSETD